MIKWSIIKNDLDSKVGKMLDVDNYAGSQCVDTPKYMIGKYWNFTTWGNAIDYRSNAMPKGFTRYNPYTKPVLPGDILVFKYGSSNIYGHVAVVRNVLANGIVECWETNVDGNADWLTVGGPMRIKRRTLSGCVKIIRPSGIEYDGDEDKELDTVKRIRENGVFTVTVPVLNVRDIPSTKNNTPVATYTNGQKVYYDSYCFNEDKVWLSYIGRSGNRRYVCSKVLENGIAVEFYGTFR